MDSIDPTAPSTFTEQFYDASTVTPVLITVKTDSNDPNKVIKVLDIKEGNISDIVTTDEAQGDTLKSSLVVIKSSAYNVQTMYIINREGI